MMNLTLPQAVALAIFGAVMFIVGRASERWETRKAIKALVQKLFEDKDDES